MIVYFQRLLQANSRQKKLFQKAMTASERVQSASYEVAEIIAHKSESHEPAESVILPVCQKWSKLRSVIKPNKKLGKFLFRTILFREELLTFQTTLSKV